MGTRKKMETTGWMGAGDPWPDIRGGGREGGVMEKERYSREETRETKRKFKVSLNIYQRCVQMELLHPGGDKFKSGITEGFIFLFFPTVTVSFYTFQAYQKSDAKSP